MILAALAAAAALAAPPAHTDAAGALYVAGNRLAADTGATYEALELAPDGTSVLALESSDATRVVLVPLRGGDPQPVVGTADADAASISPDGKSVVFSTADGLFVVAVAGGTPKQLLVTPDGAADSLPEFSPDGRTIAFARDSVDENGDETVTLETMPAAGGKPVARATGLRGSLPDGGRISYSPDGKTIAYAGGADAPGIWTVGAAAGAPQQLTGDDDYWPVYSADGATIAFARDAASPGSDASSGDPADPVDEDVDELWTVPAAGGDATLQSEGDFETLAAKQIASAAPAAAKPVVVHVTRRAARYTVRWTGAAAGWKVTLVVGRKSIGAFVPGTAHSVTLTLLHATGKPVVRVVPTA